MTSVYQEMGILNRWQNMDLRIDFHEAEPAGIALHVCDVVGVPGTASEGRAPRPCFFGAIFDAYNSEPIGEVGPWTAEDAAIAVEITARRFGLKVLKPIWHSQIADQRFAFADPKKIAQLSRVS